VRWCYRTGTTTYAASSPINSDPTVTEGLIIVLTDVTGQRRTEQEDPIACLGEPDRCQSELLSLLGHELRNPLMPIINAVQLITMHDGNREVAQWATAMLKRQTHRLTRLVDNLLDAGRIRNGVLRWSRAG